MDFPLVMKIVHMSFASLLIVAVISRAFTLFVNTAGQQPNPKARKLLTAVQHLAMTGVFLTGLIALFLKDFVIEPWFYAKVVLFLALLSALAKAYRKDDQILLLQRRGGLVIACVALCAIIALVLIKPQFG